LEDLEQAEQAEAETELQQPVMPEAHLRLEV
jgi:hypothetical protein